MELFWGALAVIAYFSWLYSENANREIERAKMAKLDNLNAALGSIDTATTELANQLTSLVERVTADDISDAELAAAVERASGLATRISDASTALAGIEPVDVPVPPVEDPTEEPPVDPGNGGVITDPIVEPPVEGTDPTQPTP